MLAKLEGRPKVKGPSPFGFVSALCDFYPRSFFDRSAAFDFSGNKAFCEYIGPPYVFSAIWTNGTAFIFINIVGLKKSLWRAQSCVFGNMRLLKKSDFSCLQSCEETLLIGSRTGNLITVTLVPLHI